MTAPIHNADVLIAGAGIVGVSTALWAQRRGMSVILADGQAPGSGASFGNAGTIATYGCVPVNSASLFGALPKMLASKTGPLRVDWVYALRNLPWMLSFLRNCAPARVRHITDSLADLLSRTDAGLDPLVAAAGAEDLFVTNDFLQVWSTKAAFDSAQVSLAVRRRHGVVFEHLSSADIAAIEPGIALRFHAGVRFAGVRHIRDPQAYVQRIFDRFILDGGTFVEANVSTAEPDDSGVTAICSNGETHRVGQMVVAAGAHSRSVIGSGAEDTPLGTERGYHVAFKDQAHRVSRPVGWAEKGFYATPMDGGLRFAGTVEIAGLDAPPTQARIDTLTGCAHEMFGDIGEPTSSWLGFRPTMPDSLPVIGRSHRSDRIFFAFGHQHLGLTLGGITGRTIADLLEGRAPNFDISAFDSARFGKIRR